MMEKDLVVYSRLHSWLDGKMKECKRKLSAAIVENILLILFFYLSQFIGVIFGEGTKPQQNAYFWFFWNRNNKYKA